MTDTAAAATIAFDNERYTTIDGEQVSKPYLAITVHLMAQFGERLAWTYP